MKAIDLKYKFEFFKHEFKADGKHVHRIGYNHKTEGLQSFEHHLNIDGTENMIVYNGPTDRNWLVFDYISRKLQGQLPKGQADHIQPEYQMLEYCIRTGRFTSWRDGDADMNKLITRLLARFSIPYKIFNLGFGVTLFSHIDLACPECSGKSTVIDAQYKSPLAHDDKTQPRVIICPTCKGTRLDPNKPLIELDGWFNYDPTKVKLKE